MKKLTKKQIFEFAIEKIQDNPYGDNFLCNYFKNNLRIETPKEYLLFNDSEFDLNNAFIHMQLNLNRFDSDDRFYANEIRILILCFCLEMIKK